MANRDEVRKELIETDDEFRRLFEEHQSHERRLDQIDENPDPAPDEDALIKGIKVQKLHLKDQMEALIRSHL